MAARRFGTGPVSWRPCPGQHDSRNCGARHPIVQLCGGSIASVAVPTAEPETAKSRRSWAGVGRRNPVSHTSSLLSRARPWPWGESNPINVLRAAHGMNEAARQVPRETSQACITSPAAACRRAGPRGRVPIIQVNILFSPTSMSAMVKVIPQSHAETSVPRPSMSGSLQGNTTSPFCEISYAGYHIVSRKHADD